MKLRSSNVKVLMKNPITWALVGVASIPIVAPGALKKSDKPAKVPTLKSFGYLSQEAHRARQAAADAGVAATQLPNPSLIYSSCAAVAVSRKTIDDCVNAYVQNTGNKNSIGHTSAAPTSQPNRLKSVASLLNGQIFSNANDGGLLTFRDINDGEFQSLSLSDESLDVIVQYANSFYDATGARLGVIGMEPEFNGPNRDSIIFSDGTRAVFEEKTRIETTGTSGKTPRDHLNEEASIIESNATKKALNWAVDNHLLDPSQFKLGFSPALPASVVAKLPFAIPVATELEARCANYAQDLQAANDCLVGVQQGLPGFETIRNVPVDERGIDLVFTPDGFRIRSEQKSASRQISCADLPSAACDFGP